MILNSNQIQEIIPHRYPFLLIDRVVELEPGHSCKAIKNVSANEMQFMGHFPDEHVMPGVLIVEAMAQAGKEVSSVFKMGKQYKFSVFNHKTQAWDESGAFGSKETAEQARDLAFKQRFDALTK